MRVGSGRRRAAGLGLALAALFWVTAACTGTAAPGPSASPASPSVDLSGELRARAGRLLGQGATGAVVRVDDGHRVVQFAVGLADLKPRRELGLGDEFRVGSTTKTFMAALALQLVAERRLGSRSASLTAHFRVRVEGPGLGGRSAVSGCRGRA